MLEKPSKKIKSKKDGKRRLVLLDAHAIIHRAYHALPDFSSSKGEPTGALYGLASMLMKIINDLKPDYLIACFDLAGPTYRHEAYEEYKAGRAKTDDELVLQLERSRDLFKAFAVPIYDQAGFEADDILGTIVDKLKKENINLVIASGDMDTLQLVDGQKVKVFTLKKGINDTVMYDEEAVKERFGFGPELLPDYKGLRGDPSDNIIGIAGIGEKTATTLIREFGKIENIYQQLKKDETKLIKAGVKPRIIELLKAGEEEAHFSKMLATIRRDAPIKFSLPKKVWSEEVSFDTVSDLFAELDFRTLKGRLKELLKPETGQLIPDGQAVGSNADQPSFNVVGNEGANPAEIKEMTVALWLVNSNITNPTLDDALNFAQTKSFTKAKEKIFEELRKQKLDIVFKNIEKPLIAVLDKIKERGIKVDKKYLKKLSTSYHRELEILEKKIWQQAGEEFNINSPKQLGQILFDKLGLTAKNLKKTAGGAKSTRESELEKLREGNPIIADILEYRELQKLLSTYIDNLPEMIASDGRLHTTFIQTGAATGRMASQDPNLQNIPIKSERGQKIRHAFVAAAGFKLVALDYSQIELRIAAFLSGDRKLIEIFKNERDVHTEVAAEVFGVPAEMVDKEMRRQAKVINFGILYGMGVNALRANLGTSRDEAQKFYNDYFRTFSGLAKYLENTKAEAHRQGYVETWFGRRRYFEGIRSRLPFIRAAAERMAINAPIQGTSADIIKIAMVRIDDYLVKKGLGEEVRLLLQVHDELVYEIKDDFVKEVTAKIKEIMEGVIDPKETRGVVCRVNAAVGENWGKLEELKL